MYICTIYEPYVRVLVVSQTRDQSQSVGPDVREIGVISSLSSPTTYVPRVSFHNHMSIDDQGTRNNVWLMTSEPSLTVHPQEC